MNTRYKYRVGLGIMRGEYSNPSLYIIHNIGDESKDSYPGNSFNSHLETNLLELMEFISIIISVYGLRGLSCSLFTVV